MQVREAEADDREVVTGLWRACGLTVPWNDPEEDFDLCRQSGHGAVLVIESEDARLLGSVMVGHDGHRGWVYYLSVAADAREQGIGQRLMAAAEDWVRARGVRKLELMVRRSNEAVGRFYENRDYKREQVIVYSRWLDGTTTEDGHIGRGSDADMFPQAGRTDDMTDGEVQFIRDPDGRPLFAVLPITEYERLLHRAEHEVSPLDEPANPAPPPAQAPRATPPAVAARLEQGENPILVWREHRDLPREVLAAWIGFDEEDVAAFEADPLLPTAEIYHLIAQALDVELKDLLEPAQRMARLRAD